MSPAQQQAVEATDRAQIAEQSQILDRVGELLVSNDDRERDVTLVSIVSAHRTEQAIDLLLIGARSPEPDARHESVLNWWRRQADGGQGERITKALRFAAANDPDPTTSQTARAALEDLDNQASEQD